MSQNEFKKKLLEVFKKYLALKNSLNFLLSTKKIQILKTSFRTLKCFLEA